MAVELHQGAANSELAGQGKIGHTRLAGRRHASIHAACGYTVCAAARDGHSKLVNLPCGLHQGVLQHCVHARSQLLGRALGQHQGGLRGSRGRAGHIR